MRLKLKELGVDVSKFAEGGPIIPEFQQLPVATPKTRKPTSTVTSSSIPPETPQAETPQAATGDGEAPQPTTGDDLGSPPDFRDITIMETVEAEVHHTPKSTPLPTKKKVKGEEH